MLCSSLICFHIFCIRIVAFNVIVCLLSFYRQSLRHLFATEGIRGFSKGFSLNIIKGPITLSLSLTTYDLLIYEFDRCQKQ